MENYECDHCHDTGEMYYGEGLDGPCLLCDARGLPKVLVGKHTGTRYDKVPSSYCRWVSTLDSFADMRFYAWVKTQR
jgi:hypothetical protein